jgi:hypothetical protein
MVRRVENDARRGSRSYFVRPLFLDVKLHLRGQTCWAGGTELVRSITHCPGKICSKLTQSWELECGFYRSCTFLHIDCMGWAMLGLAGELLELRGRLICHSLSVTAALLSLSQLSLGEA